MWIYIDPATNRGEVRIDFKWCEDPQFHAGQAFELSAVFQRYTGCDGSVFAVPLGEVKQHIDSMKKLHLKQKIILSVIITVILVWFVVPIFLVVNQVVKRQYIVDRSQVMGEGAEGHLICEISFHASPTKYFEFCDWQTFLSESVTQIKYGIVYFTIRGIELLFFNELGIIIFAIFTSSIFVGVFFLERKNKK